MSALRKIRGLEEAREEDGLIIVGVAESHQDEICNMSTDEEDFEPGVGMSYSIGQLTLKVRSAVERVLGYKVRTHLSFDDRCLGEAIFGDDWVNHPEGSTEDERQYLG